MRGPAVLLLLATSLVLGCSTDRSGAAPIANPRIAKAEALIDAFYSFDPQRLRRALNDAPESQPQILYYQGWAEGGNYSVLKRTPCRPANHDEWSCHITVRDDLIAALGTGYDVTDTFKLTFEGGRIVAVDTSSNDPPQFDDALTWLRRERPEVFTGPCRGFFKGGPTPQDCVRAVVKGFADFRARGGR